MAQLVGTTCLFCQNRISNELDAAFCPSCGQGSHIACRVSQSGVEGKCVTCGAPYDPHEAARRIAEHQESERRRQGVPTAGASSLPTPPLNLAATFREVRLLYKLAGFLIPAVLLILLGIFFITSPEMREKPDAISAGEVGRGLAISVAGVAVGLLGWWWYRSARRKAARSSVKAGLVSEAINTAVRAGE